MPFISITKIVNYIVFISLLVCSSPLIAQQVLKVGVGNFPPFFIKKDNKGIFIDIIDEIFKQLPEYKVQYIFMSNHRLLHEINLGQSIDVACNVFPNAKVNGYLSEPVFRFSDVAISRKSDQLTLNNIADLQDKSIAAYQGATELLGDSFKQMANNNADYNEYPHPKETTLLMLSGQKDIRVGDLNIFWYDLNNKYYDKAKDIAPDDFTVHYLWPSVFSHMAFNDPILKDRVDEVIIKLKRNGTMEKIYSRYKLQ